MKTKPVKITTYKALAGKQTLTRIVNEAYKAFRKEYNVKQYKLIDIDGNGVKEMLYYRYDYPDSGRTRWFDGCGVCTYNKKTKKVVKLAELSNGKAFRYIGYNKSEHSFRLIHGDTGGWGENTYRLKGTKLKLRFKLRADNSKFNRTPAYYVNGEKVSDKVFDKYNGITYGWPTVSFK